MKVNQAIFAGSSQCIENKPKRKAPEFAFIGRSNVGKSSLINMLCSKKNLAHTSSTPGKTILINHFLVNDRWYLVDLPGYGFAKMSKVKRDKLQKMIQDFIGKSEELELLFVLLDSRHQLLKIDLEFLTAVKNADVPFAIIFTKCDKLGKNALQKSIDDNTSGLAGRWGELPPIFTSSAETMLGKEEILDFIDETLKTLQQ